MKKIIIVTAMVILPGCCTMFGRNCPEGKCTTPGMSKCLDNKLMLCDGNKEWKVNRDCSKYKAVCKQSGDVHICGKAGK